MIPTSNHNYDVYAMANELLYIFWFLHQTTTISFDILSPAGCISFDSYIKPQLIILNLKVMSVVYLLIPTSNHNVYCSWLCWCRLYIFWFLHQTTTCFGLDSYTCCCISFDSYIKPQLLHSAFAWWSCCISFDSYIKPQHIVVWWY